MEELMQKDMPQPALPKPISLWTLFTREIAADDVFLRASALAYSTLASLVPIFAILLAILSGPAFRDHHEQILDTLANTLVPNDDEDTWILSDIQESPQQEHFKSIFRENIVALAQRAGAVSLFGFLLLFVTVWMLFRTVENSFNVIWRATRVRSVLMRLLVAVCAIFWGPILIAISVTLTEKFQTLPFIGAFFIPILFSTLSFSILYKVMPNTQVNFKYALFAGATTALCWEGAKLLFLVYVTHIVSYNRVYGSLGLIPMLFLWVYINWVIILGGGELAYCLQFRSGGGSPRVKIER